ncbi:phosphatidylglycerophosphatase A family protein [Gracilimonas mengyeensis]|uniref:Phosphatidylglycerophosphatase A n=1 Tax=Gracilimonas mengyeensis TaxID=1302730 RepID=A0A521E9Z1_9BACT|nr:phosphatidylglycerophosphatase A [Gracilimonas mengyeensis]SMO80734.1 phosphatidylglycerophosphatase A [Gracilimonas mengyeensis]
MNALKFFLGTGCFSGLFPKTPGTAGSLVFLFPLYHALQISTVWPVILIVLSASAVCLWIASYFEDIYGKDPGILVMDEWAGQALVFLGMPYSGLLEDRVIMLLTGFILFRFFDLFKPLGISKLQDLPLGFGIFMDDLLAGLYALLCLKTLIFMWPNLFGMI